MIEDIVIKYAWSACGYCLISIPVFFRGPKLASAVAGVQDHAAEGKSIANRTESMPPFRYSFLGSSI